MRQLALQERDAIAQFPQQPVHHPAIFRVIDVFNFPPKFPSFLLEPLNLGNPFRFRIVCLAHCTASLFQRSGLYPAGDAGAKKMGKFGLDRPSYHLLPSQMIDGRR
jgi:hypothetical protein